MILVFGSVNLDVIHHVAVLPRPGQTVTGTVRVEGGGKGANQAVAAARDGAAVAFAGAVGRDPAADTALAGLLVAGVDLSQVVVTELPTGMASIVVDAAGENQIAVGSGANGRARAHQVADAALGPGTTVLLQMEVDQVETAALIRRARSRGARVVLNLAPAAAIDGDALRMVDWLVLNEGEAEWLAGYVGAAADAGSLHARLGVGLVLTRGAKGVDLAAASGALHCPALELRAIDTTGAGDCFTGVFAAALDRGADSAEALRRATVAAGLSCMLEGSQRSFPTKAEIDPRLHGR